MMVIDTLQFPVALAPIFKERLWGGDRLSKSLFQAYQVMPCCGESWVLSTVPGSISCVTAGRHAGEPLTALIAEYKEMLMGKYVYEKYKNGCPLLVKCIDAADDLSVQVHPNDLLAAKYHNCVGKTEVWYMMEVAPNARIASGFQVPMTVDSYQAALRAGTLLDMLHVEAAQAGDVFFIPAGRIHSMGKGVLFAEIQQSSDITYRTYDFNRRDAKTHKPRALHIEESIQALDFSATKQAKTTYTDTPNAAVRLVQEDHFVVHKLHCKQGSVQRDMRAIDSFVAYLCIQGEVAWEGEAGRMLLQAGNCVLVPATLSHYAFHSVTEGVLLEAYVPAVL